MTIRDDVEPLKQALMMARVKASEAQNDRGCDRRLAGVRQGISGHLRSGGFLLTGSLPVPGQEVVELAGRMIGDAVDDVGEPGLGIELLSLAIVVRVLNAAARSPRASDPATLQFSAQDPGGGWLVQRRC
jgi:hypothetical protein